MKVTWEAAGATDVGLVRQGNEDAYLLDADHGVFLVADGMGGHAAGEIASAIASEAVGRTLINGVEEGLQADELARALARSLHAAHHAIVAYGQANPATAGMGTTMTSLVVCDDGTFRLGHIGDSRMYVLRHGRMQQVTRDHTWVQAEVDAGRLTPRGARRHRYSHILTRALGADSLDRPDLIAGTFLPGDLVLLATDGLTGMLTDRMIRRILSHERPLDAQVSELIDAANRRGGRDNITAVLVRILDADPIPVGDDDTLPLA
ncbi:MAG TPA: PP2C family serine/threonine-protein phosphatase [Longimicrobium sp.]|nr:PP2C family serine/threonine-protein phosphatase [Longimicrobium sp.]